MSVTEVSYGTAVSHTGEDTPAGQFAPGEAVDVVCDRAGRAGALSYRVPDGVTVRIGDAVSVPLGRRRATGVVVAGGNPGKATREITQRHGRRTGADELAVAGQIAERHYVNLDAVTPRLAPTSGKGAEAVVDDDVVLRDATVTRRDTSTPSRTLVLRAPLHHPAKVAAAHATRLAAHGQVLVLCPTVELVTLVLAEFHRGARRLDRKADYGAWKGFAHGSVAVGVGTRAAALYTAPRLSGIVVLEEDHPGHRERTQPATHAREVAALRTDRSGAELVCVASKPTAHAVSAATRVEHSSHASDDLAAADGWPRFSLLVRSDLPPSDRRYPPELAKAVRAELDSGATPTIVAERRAATRRCVRCGKQRTCPDCQHEGAPQSTCPHFRGRNATVRPACSRCGDTGVRVVGWDRPRVQELVPDGVDVVTLSELAGAQDRGLVAYLDIDAPLRAPGVHSDDHVATALLTAAAAAGVGGRVIAVTDQPDHPVIRAVAVDQDLDALASRTHRHAEQHQLPPFTRMVTITLGWDQPPDVSEWPGTVYGPSRRGEDWEVLVRLDGRDAPKMRRVVSRLRARGRVRVRVD